MTAYALQARPIAVELHALLRELDPARWREDTEAALRLRISRVRAALEELRTISVPDDSLARLTERISELERLMLTQATALSARAALTREEWHQFGLRLRPSYEALRQTLRAEDIHVPSLRPTNYKRNLLHVLSGFVALGVVLAVPSPGWLVGIAATFFVYAWSMEGLRRRSSALNDKLMSFYGPVAHPHEWHRVNSATWYCTALLALALTRSPAVCAAAVLVLGVGDPSAALIGRRWGRIKLLNGRSLEGSLTFVATGSLVAFAALATLFPALSIGAAAAMAGAAAVAGAAAELVSRRIDDNLTIPVAAGLAAWATAALLALPAL